MAVVLRGVERWLGERKNPEDGGREENRARRPPPVRRGRVAWGTGGQSAERDRSAGGALRTFPGGNGSNRGRCCSWEACFISSMTPNPLACTLC